MFDIDLKEDIHSVTEFRSNINGFITQIKETHRPLVLTQNGKSSAVVLDVNDYQRMIDRMAIIDDVMLGKQQYKNGEGISHKEFTSELLNKYKK